MSRTYLRKMVAATAALLLALTATAALAETGSAPEIRPIFVTAPEKLNIEGNLEWTELEGGFFQVGGYGLIGDEQLFHAMAGRRVIVKGTEFTGMSTRMVKQIQVESLLLGLEASHPAPDGVTVNGKLPVFDQGPVVVDGVLMVPLRAVVEAAGGTVTWNGAERSVFLKLPDRNATFWIGKDQAEMNENGVYYFKQNLITMAKAPVIVNSRTLISADALEKILGLVERADHDPTLHLQVKK